MFWWWGTLWHWMSWRRGRCQTRCEDRSYSVTCHSKPYVKVGETHQRRLLLRPFFFCCFENRFVFFFFDFSLSCECDVWHKCFRAKRRQRWCKRKGKIHCAVNKSGVYFCFICVTESEVRQTWCVTRSEFLLHMTLFCFRCCDWKMNSSF